MKGARAVMNMRMLLTLGGFLFTAKQPGSALERTYWTRYRGGSTPAQRRAADIAMQERAEGKRFERAAKLREHAARGAYGLTPRVGQRGYTPNYPIRSARGAV